ncbi:tetratricopeptide repeat protein [Microseira sp. BLCC-F43]|uniref:tetratricopeptide repeat protein n=1 Tax=Microseira sp. BLCC-F43 TaxID=3153602 RepID=UPI0035B74025
MKEFEEEYQKENKRNLRKLILSINASFGKLNLLIAICDNRRYRDEVIQTYETELRAKGVRSDRIKINGNQPSLKESLQKLVEQQSKGELDKLYVVTVLGASDLLDLRLREPKSALERFLFSVQWTREALGSFQFPIVLWVTQRIAAELAKQAPDFWSWRGGVFEFFYPTDTRSLSQDVIIPEIREPMDREPLADIEELQQQIDNLKKLEPDSPLLGSLYQTLGETYFQKVQRGQSKSPQTDLDLSIASLQQAAQEFEKSDRKSELADCLEWIGYIQKSVGDWNQAEANFQKSLQLRQELGDRAGMATSYGQLGDIERNRGNWEAAESLYRQYQQMCQELGDRAGMATSYGQLGDIERKRGNWDAAESLYRQCLQIEQELGDRAGMASCWGLLGDIERNRGNWEAAESLYRQYQQMCQELGDRAGMASCWGVLGSIERKRGNWDAAESLYRQSLNLATDLNYTWQMAHSNYDLAQLYRATDNSTLAQQHYQTAHQLFTQIGAKKEVEKIEKEWRDLEF